MQDELTTLWRDLEARCTARAPKGGYSSGFQCWGCRKFVASRTATCPHCGQQHGGIWHDAYPCR